MYFVVLRPTSPSSSALVSLSKYVRLRPRCSRVSREGVFLSARARHVARLILVGAALALLPLPARAQVTPKSVLFVYSGERNVAGNSTGRHLAGAALVDLALERTLRTALEGSLYHYTEDIDTTRLGDTSYAQDVLSLLRSKYEGRQLDLIFVGGDVAVDFISRHRASFFPDVPLVFYAVDPVPAPPNSTGIVTPISQRRVLEMALRVQPDTRHIAIVAGTTAYDQYYVRAAREELKSYEGRLGFTYLTGLPMRELLRRVATLPANSIILFMGVTEDGEGRLFLPQETLDSISAAANAPTYGWNGGGMDHGLVGGTVYSQEVLGPHMAALGLRVMKGERAETIPVTEFDWSTTEFDWRQLQRWNISESRLPAGSTVMFRQPGVWDQYKVYIVGAAMIVVLQSAFIAGFLVQRIRRRRTELALRQSYEQNQDLAGRLISAQEAERSRIARDLHDDLSQQLAGLGIMLSGLRRKVARLDAEPEIDRTVTTLQDRTSVLAQAIRNLSHELHPGVLEHAGLVATLRRHCAEVQEDHHVAVIFTANDGLEVLSPEVALCLFRVAQETLTNAVRHARARMIHVQLAATNDGVELRVDDDGVGFVTSERTGRGLGLRSIDERVRLIKGHLTVESRPGQGTSLQVQIPLAAVQVAAGL